MENGNAVVESKGSRRKDRIFVGVFTGVVLVIAAALLWVQFDDSAKFCYKTEICGFKISQRINYQSKKWKTEHTIEQIKDNSEGGVDICCDITDSKVLPGFEKMILCLDKSDRILSIYCRTAKASNMENGVAYYDMMLPRLESRYGKIQKWINTNFGDSPLLRYGSFPAGTSKEEELHFDFFGIGNSSALYLRKAEAQSKFFMKYDEWKRLHP